MNLLRARVVSAAISSVQAVENEFGNDCTMGLASERHVATDCSIHWVGEDTAVSHNFTPDRLGHCGSRLRGLAQFYESQIQGWDGLLGAAL